MKKIEPYYTTTEAKLALDNGGRFYNILTNANDGEIELSELSKVAGVFGEKQKMVLFLDLAIVKLSENSKNEVIQSFSEGLQKTYKKYKSASLSVLKANEIGRVSSNVIITGHPKHVDSKNDFVGFIMIPIMVGKVTTFTMIPIMDQYDVYEIRDEKTSQTFLIAHARGELKLPDSKVIVAGILKELKATKEEDVGSKKYLEAYYFIESD
jgi:hypothetical protein